MAGKQKYSYDTEEWRRSHEEDRSGPTTAARRGNAANYVKDTRNLSSKGYPSSTNPTSQPSTPKKTTRTGFTNSNRQRNLPYVGEGKDFEVDKGNLRDRGYPSSTNPTSQPKTKKTIGTLEAKEKAKTRSIIEAAFVGNSKSAPPSKEEQERMRKQGARNAANQYSGKYSGRRG